MIRKPAYVETSQGIGLDWNHWARNKLVGHWMFNEGGGRKVYDISGYQNHGVFVDNTTWGGGRTTTGVVMDGAGDYINCGHDSSLNLTDNVTMTAFVNFDVTSSLQAIINKKWGEYEIGIDNNGRPRVAYRNQLNQKYIVTGITFTVAGKWYFIVGTIQAGGSVKIYLNGRQENSNAFVGTSIDSEPNDDMTIGVGNNKGGLFVNGIIDSVRIYNRILNDGEIQELYRNPFAEYRNMFWRAGTLGRIMGSLAGHGGLAGVGGLAGNRGGIAA